jgi:hypothetical protein
VRSRLASTIQPAPATFLWPVPTIRWYCPSAGVCLTRHHRGFIRIHPSALPQPVTPGWDEGPWALASGFAPRGCPRRTLRWGQALHTGLGPTLRHPSSLLGGIHSSQAASRRKCSKQQLVVPGRPPRQSYQQALPHQGKPSLAGHTPFSSIVAAPGHAGLISNPGLTAMQPCVFQVAGDRQGRGNAFLPLLLARARPVTTGRAGGSGLASGHRHHIKASRVPYSRTGSALAGGSHPRAVWTKWQTMC